MGLFSDVARLDVLFGMRASSFCLVLDPVPCYPLLGWLPSRDIGTYPEHSSRAPGEAEHVDHYGWSSMAKGEKQASPGRSLYCFTHRGFRRPRIDCFGAHLQTLVLMFGLRIPALCILASPWCRCSAGGTREGIVLRVWDACANIGLDPILGVERWSFGCLLQQKFRLSRCLGFFALRNHRPRHYRSPISSGYSSAANGMASERP